MKDIKIPLKKTKINGEKKVQERYPNFTEEEKEKRQYYREHNKNLFKEKNQKLVEYRRVKRESYCFYKIL